MKLSTVNLVLTITVPTAVVQGQLLNDGKGLFSYDPQADNGPPVWFSIDTSPDVNACSGNRQSPVGFSVSDLQECDMTNAPYTFEGGTCTAASFNYFNNDHSVEFEYPEDGSCEAASMQMPGIDGVYEATQCHVHMGSEHTLEGENADFELHCVHVLKSGSGVQEVSGITNTQAVLGIGFVGKSDVQDHPEFAAILAGWEEFYTSEKNRCAGGNSTSSVSPPDTVFNVYGLVPADATVLTYQGSLTTPPCTEDLWWNVVGRAIYISDTQMMKLQSFVLGYLDENCVLATGADPNTNSTSRAAQDLNGRTVSTMCLGDGPAAPPSAATNNYNAFTLASAVTTVMFGLFAF